MKYYEAQLRKWIKTVYYINCTSCMEWNQISDALNKIEAVSSLFKIGWRSTKAGNLYCPECAKKKLKQ